MNHHQYEFNIETTGGTTTVTPYIQRVNVGSRVVWNLLQPGQAQIVFPPGAQLRLERAVADPKRPAEACATAVGVVEGLVSTWVQSQKVTVSMFIIIIDP